MSIQRYHVGPRLSEIVVHNNTVYLAGQVADAQLHADAQAQTEEILGMIDRLLGEVGSDKTKILTAQIWLADMADYDAMNRAWSAWVPQGHTPARATVESRLAAPEYKVEIKIVAAL
ncbi:RidA family protein [Chitinimonas taiwanensis]|jgi:enamine deaminase RidA (YjgF/YER057c/UK114 family)|uniref:Enamine deaminase RidA, house cleaning of reactive enamine intermediates, YjgF/YER057c/UK114 family n=1 Tax=Chitinimonas taiwanensis DSM 18899 TaxID=1121279 RepID=A0A1K2HBI9_9NEIS|nr:RidA family protein [Chitinimonas taiwanensis]SFZ74103.1 Enamine deaminase RidA, house cleaning of reactive enamine intermediates, YjgF/YER057c/UK114 family [Chitinimonas taiwanensis DSM 18899]